MVLRECFQARIDRFELDVLVQRIAADILLEEEDLFIRFEAVEQFDDVRVVKSLHAGNLSLNCSLLVDVV